MVKEEFAKIYGEENWKDNKNVLQAALGKGFETGKWLAEENEMPVEMIQIIDNSTRISFLGSSYSISRLSSMRQAAD